MYKVKNVSDTYQNYKYTIIREVIKEIEYWYYGGYNNIVVAQEVVKEVNNGILVTPDLIEVDF
jgi:hypothetical protein